MEPGTSLGSLISGFNARIADLQELIIARIEATHHLSASICRAKGGSNGFKVAILGAAGGIGQPLSLLMKMNPLVWLLHLYDIVNTPGVTADFSHMDTGAVEEA